MTIKTEEPPRTAAQPGAKSSTERQRRFAEEGRVLNVFSHGFLALWAFMIVFPLLWVVLGAFKTNTQIGESAWSWPSHWSFGAFSRAWSEGIGGYFANTLLVMVMSVTATMVLGAMAAYVLARYRFRGNRIVYYGFVAGAMFPVYLALVPLFFQVNDFHLLNSYVGLALVYTSFSLPFTVFFLHSFFSTLPTAVHEAAFVDGCSHTRAFFQVMMPIAKPGLISVGIFNVLGQWNQYLLPVVLMQQQRGDSEAHQVLTQGLVNLMAAQGYAADFPALFAGMTIAMLPVLAVYLSFQRQVQAGLTAGTLK